MECVHTHHGGDGGRQRAERAPPPLPPRCACGLAGLLRPPKEGDLGSAAKSWNSLEEREFDSPTPGVRAKNTEPSRRKTYNDFE